MVERMTPIVQCLGKNCAAKWECAHYYSLGLPGRAPVERLCEGKPTPEPLPKKESK